jgi:cob(I)alamin adenosyltransferase
MKIYTRNGDRGQTRIIGKEILYKSDPRVEAYGSIDELNSWIGYIRSILDANTKVFDAELEELQQLLFDCGHDLATPKGEERSHFIFDSSKCVKWLEDKIDTYNDQVEPVKKFILPGGCQVASAMHYARTITRRAERNIVALKLKKPINEEVLVFINRLSDYFFIAARYANHLEKHSETLYRNSKDVFH